MAGTCAVNHTIKGGPCLRPASAEFAGEGVCGYHARRFASGALEYGAYLEEVAFRIEAWLRTERPGAAAETVRGLEEARERAVLELDLAREDLELEDWERRVVSNGVRALFEALERHEPAAAGRSREVAGLAAEVAREIGLSGSRVAEVEHVGLLCHIGKIKVPKAVLEKEEPLSDEEWEVIRSYPLVGARIVARIAGLSHLPPPIRAQHERWDGRGYPDGLRGEEIPLPARVVFACEAYRAMTSRRPYRAAMTPEAAREELRRNAGTQFSPSVVEGLLAVTGREIEARR